MANSFGKNVRVSWHWGTGRAEGKIVERFERRISRTLKGARVTRVGTKDNPAYLIEQDDGDKVLKRGSELSGA